MKLLVSVRLCVFLSGLDLDMVSFLCEKYYVILGVKFLSL